MFNFLPRRANVHLPQRLALPTFAGAHPPLRIPTFSKFLPSIHTKFYSSATGPVIGIDLGTTNSCVSVISPDGTPIVIEHDGKRTTPSIVALEKTGNRLVGQTAQRQMVVNPKNTFFATKRLIGRRFGDPEVANLAKQVPYTIVSGPNGDAWVADETGKKYSPEQIASFILMKLKQVASDYLGCEVNRAVITVPAYFDNHQRQATEAAGKIAGLYVERIINEPTAAALAYGISREEDKIVAVYDLGGGTFDISILEIGGGVFEVKSTSGDTFLGGEDFNSVLADYIIKSFVKKESINLAQDKVALQRVREAAENAKHELSTRDFVNVSLPYICVDKAGLPKNLDVSISRREYEDLVDDLIKKSLGPCKTAIKDAGVSIEDITDVVLVGGMTRMPKVREYVKAFFKKEPFAGVNPDEAVAVGAALQGGLITNKGLVPGSSDREIVLLDVTPLNLGIEVTSGELAVIIPAQTPIPCSKTHTFTTVADFQTQLQTKVYQGNRPIAKDNRLLGQYTVTGIPPAPASIPKIDVTFTCSANGTITATSRDRAAGVNQGITINMAGGLSPADIERMKKEAESYKEQDEKRQELLRLQEKARSIIATTQHGIASLEAAVKSSLSAQIDVVNATINDLQNMLQKEPRDKIEEQLTLLEQKSKVLLTDAYNMRAKN